ncbi:MAG: hypothetical protein ACREGB_01545, partial [Candidatus Saccharimonadales bacterium]
MMGVYLLHSHTNPGVEHHNLEVVSVGILTKKQGKHVATSQDTPSIVTRGQVINAIVNNSTVEDYLGRKPSLMEAADTIDWVIDLVQDCRDSGYEVVYPTESQMDSLSYTIFDALMPHGQKAYDTGSTADLLAKHVLDPSR